MIKFNLKLVLILSICMILLGYTVFYISKDISYANAYLAGYIIILSDLLLLFRYLNTALKHSAVTTFLIQSILRWLFIGFCIYIAIAVLKLYKWSFIIGIILPFMVVFITGIYQIFRGKEDGTSS